MSSAKSVHLYVHIPFCLKRCPFCRFTRSYDESYLTNISIIPEYLQALEREIQACDKDVEILDIQFGGGTPTLLTKKQLQHILNLLYTQFNFSGKCQISLEALPNTLGEAKIEELVDLGIDRVSLGVQDTNPTILRLLNRQYSKEDIAHVVELMKRKGIPKINIDLISGLPGQSRESWETTLRDVIALDTTTVTVTNFMEYYKGYEQFIESAANFGFTPAGIELKNQLMMQANQLLTAVGFENCLGHLYCKPGFRYQYEIDIFTVQDNVISFGPGIQTIYDNTITIKAGDIAGYLHDPFGIKKLVITDCIEDYIRLNLFAPDGIKQADFEKRFNTSIDAGIVHTDYVKNLLIGLSTRGYIIRDDQGIRLKPEHFMDGVVYIYHYADENKL